MLSSTISKEELSIISPTYLRKTLTCSGSSTSVSSMIVRLIDRCVSPRLNVKSIVGGKFPGGSDQRYIKILVVLNQRQFVHSTTRLYFNCCNTHFYSLLHEVQK